MVKKGQDETRYDYKTEKEEAEETKEDAYKKLVKRQIFDTSLKNYYESLLSLEKSRRDMEEPHLENLFDSSERRYLEEQVMKLMNLRGRDIQSLTGFDDEGKKWNLVRETGERREERPPRNPEIKILETAFHETVSRFGKSDNGDSSSSSREWDLRESKSRVISLGIKLTRALIKVSLLDLHTSQRKKQSELKRWILLRSCKEQSAVMFLIDFLLYKAEKSAKFEQPLDSDVLSEERVPEKERISDHLLKRFAETICGLQLVAMNLYGTLDRSKDLNAMNLELDRCVEHVRKVEKAIKDMMIQPSLRLKHTSKEFWKKMDAEMDKCWGESFWRYVETTRRLKSVITSHNIVYALCLRFELGV